MQALGVDIQTIQSIVGHADTEMTEHDLHVQESIRQSAVQLFIFYQNHLVPKQVTIRERIWQPAGKEGAKS